MLHLIMCCWHREQHVCGTGLFVAFLVENLTLVETAEKQGFLDLAHEQCKSTTPLQLF